MKPTRRPIQPLQKPLIFVSHDSRDAEIAKAFCKLLCDSSMGMLQVFCSSDRTRDIGIDYGANWYETIRKKLALASEVVCLLTPRSLDKPWILYEAGLAAGKSEETPVRGLVLGMNLAQANCGPFAQLQNCDGNPAEVTALVAKMMKRLLPVSEPPSNVIRPQVDLFLRTITPLLEENGGWGGVPKSGESEPVDLGLTAHMLEEVKELVNSLPSRLEAKLPRSEIQEVTLRLHESIKAAEELRSATEQSLRADSQELHARIVELHTIVKDRLAGIPAISALLKCGIINIHEDRPSAENRIIDLLTKAKAHVEVIGVSLRSLFQGGGRLNKAVRTILENPAESKRDAPKWRVLVIDPQCDQARYRSEREEPGTKMEDANLFLEVNQTIKVVNTLKDGWKCNIELRAYKGSPSCFLMVIDNVLFVEQYHYGSAGGLRVAELVPLLEFGSASNTYRELLGHFEYMWDKLSRPMMDTRDVSHPTVKRG